MFPQYFFVIDGMVCEVVVGRLETWCRSRACVLKWSCEDVSDGHIESRSIILLKDGCFQKWWYPQIIHFNDVFHYKPSILGYPYFWKHPDVASIGLQNREFWNLIWLRLMTFVIFLVITKREGLQTPYLLLWGSCAADTVDGNYPSCTTWDVKKHPVNSQINYVPIIRCRISSINIRLKFAEAFDAACVAARGNSQILDKLKDGFDQSPAWSGWFRLCNHQSPALRNCTIARPPNWTTNSKLR